MIGLYTVSSQVSDMARRRMKTKIQPAVQTLQFEVTNVPSTSLTTKFIDLSQCASIMNRRFYRQGLNWAVSGIKVMATGSGDRAFEGFVACSKLPNTWVMSNAWEKSFRAWQQMIKNATDESGSSSIKGKFLDFKIYADSKHHNDGFGANLLPYTVDSTNASTITAQPGQWQASDITIPSTTSSPGSATDYELIAVGANDPGQGASGKNAKSIIQGYADSRALPFESDPNVPADASLNWMVAMFSDGTVQDNAVIGMLEVTGDEAPYPFEGDGTNTDTMYPGGETQLNALQIHDQDFLTGTTIGGTVRMKGGNFPCGLMRFDILNQGSQSHDLILQVDLVPGNHRGYLCEPMTEM